jgi:hypothetical protein
MEGNRKELLKRKKSVVEYTERQGLMLLSNQVKIKLPKFS